VLEGIGGAENIPPLPDPKENPPGAAAAAGLAAGPDPKENPVGAAASFSVGAALAPKEKGLMASVVLTGLLFLGEAEARLGVRVARGGNLSAIS